MTAPRGKAAKKKASAKRRPARPRASAAAIVEAVAAGMRRLDPRPWTLVEYADADWAHGYCAGDRVAAWRAAGDRLARVSPPALLAVPYAQFCADGSRVLIEHSTAEGTGVGAVYELRRAGKRAAIAPLPDGMRWRTFT